MNILNPDDDVNIENDVKNSVEKFFENFADQDEKVVYLVLEELFSHLCK